MKICTSITGWDCRTIRDLMQFATFTTNFRHVLCDLCETRFNSLSDCIQRDRPELEACTTFPIPIVIFAPNNRPMQWVKVSLISFLISRKFWCPINKGTYCVTLNSHKSTVHLHQISKYAVSHWASGVSCVSFVYDKALKIAIIS